MRFEELDNIENDLVLYVEKKSKEKSKDGF